MQLFSGNSAPPIPGVNFPGHWTLVYFYPKDFTSGCTTEACSLRDNFAELQKKVTIIGVSADSESSHDKFKQKYSLPFALVADPDKKIIQAYGTDGLIFAKRTSFLINPQGKISKIYDHVNPSTHASQILTDLDQLE